MENEEVEFLSVKEFAERAGVSRQAVYQSLQTPRLAKYVKVENGKRRISSEGLGLFRQANNVKIDAELLDNLDIPGENSSESINLVDSLREQMDTMKSQDDWLKSEIQRLSMEIDRLTAEIRYKDSIIEEKDKRILDYSDRFATLAEQAQELAGRAQALHAADTMPTLIKGADAEVTAASDVPVAVKSPEPDSAEPVSTPTEQIHEPQEKEDLPKRKSFWKWLTGSN